MITIDCPLCAGDATADEALTLVTCDGCGIAPSRAGSPSRSRPSPRRGPHRSPGAATGAAAVACVAMEQSTSDRRHPRGRSTARRSRPDLRRRGQPVGPARRRPPAGHADRPAQGRTRAGRPRRRLARPSRARGAVVVERARPDLGPGDPPRRSTPPARTSARWPTPTCRRRWR